MSGLNVGVRRKKGEACAVRVSNQADAPSPGHTRKGKPLNKIRNTRNLRRTVSTLMVSIGLTLVTTAAPALAGGTWAG